MDSCEICVGGEECPTLSTFGLPWPVYIKKGGHGSPKVDKVGHWI